MWYHLLPAPSEARLQAKQTPVVVKEVVEKPILIEKEVIREPTVVEKIVEKIKIVDVSEEEKRRLEERNLEQQRHLRESFEIERNVPYHKLDDLF